MRATTGGNGATDVSASHMGQEGGGSSEAWQWSGTEGSRTQSELAANRTLREDKRDRRDWDQLGRVNRLPNERSPLWHSGLAHTFKDALALS
jgi:hypothetical protein